MPTYGVTLFVEADDHAAALELAKKIRTQIPEARSFPAEVAFHKDATPTSIARSALVRTGTLPFSYVGGIPVDG